jgi:undecaprenyl diphosphate synthase
MKLLSQYLDSEIEELHSNGIRLSTIGDVSRLPNALQSKIVAAKEKTGNNTAMTLNIALSYGGRQEIIRAAIRIAEHIKSDALSPEDVTEEMFGGFLSTAGLPDPDLLIRTGGELRISNFLLWQSAYTELYFTDTLWPDFNEDRFQEAIDSYLERQRRFGKTSEQIKTGKRAR